VKRDRSGRFARAKPWWKGPVQAGAITGAIAAAAAAGYLAHQVPPPVTITKMVEIPGPERIVEVEVPYRVEVPGPERQVEVPRADCPAAGPPKAVTVIRPIRCSLARCLNLLELEEIRR
jgi:hypothetical protein